jgi:hypothetical protein
VTSNAIDPGAALDAELAPRRAAWGPALAAGGVLLVGCTIAGLVDPRGGPPLCPFKIVTGLDCPGCGATRALHFAMRGQIETAAGYNLLFVIALPFLLAASFVGASQLFGGPWQLPPLRVSRRTWWILGAVVVAFWVLRNLPFAPFDALGT